jgi:hypothetical protein
VSKLIVRVILFALVLACPLSGCANIFHPHKESIVAVFNVQPKDPLLKQLSAITEKLELVGSGQFRPGVYQLNGKSLRVVDNTQFWIKLSLPIKDPNVISTADAVGSLYTSQALIGQGFGLPQNIELEKGKVSGEVDLVRTFGAFFLNVIQTADLSKSEGGGMKKMIQSMEIKKATMYLRPGSVFEKEGKTFHIGNNSTIEMDNVVSDKSSNYRGDLNINIKFLPDCHWIGEKVNCHFNGGSALAKLRVDRKGEILTFFSREEEASSQSTDLLDLKDCIFEFGKLKRSSARCSEALITLEKVVWQKKDEQKSELHLNAPLQLVNTNLVAKTDTQETVAFFPGKNPCDIQIDIASTGRSTSFSTLKPALAKTARIQFTKPSSRVVLVLADANVGPISFDKSGDLDLELTKGKAKLLSLEWTNGKKHFVMRTPGTSELSIPEGMSLSLGKEKGTEMNLPMHIKFGTATMEGTAGRLKLADLNGTVLLKIERELSLHSNVEFTLEESDLFGMQKADIKVENLDFQAKGSEAVAHLGKCIVNIPEQALQVGIQSQFPKQKTIDIDKTFLLKRKWRYKDAKVSTATVKNLKLEKMAASNSNEAEFRVASDVVLQGTVQKSSLMAIFKEPTSYKTKPWSITAHVTGTGKLKYKYLPKDSLANSGISYTLAMELALPEDIDLDWNKVENGIFSSIERSVILGSLQDASPIPFNYTGEVKIFSGKNPQLQTIMLKNVVTKPSSDGTEVSFVGDATF